MSVYDFFLEHSGDRRGYVLARDDQNRPLFNDLLAETVAPQRTTGDFGYPSTLAKHNVSLVAQDWSGGAGLLQEEEGAQATTSYSHTQGVDLSWGRGYLSPARTAASDPAEAIIKVLFTSFGTFAISATTVWEYNTSTDVWDSVLASVTPTDIIEFESNIFVAMGTNDYYTSVDGTTWLQITVLADQAFEFWALRSGQSGSAVLWGLTTTGSLQSNTSGLAAGAAWSAATQIGDTWETNSSMIVAEDFIYVFKEEGIYSFDGTIVEDVFPARTLARPNNGRHTLLWFDGLIYTNYGGRLLRFDPVSRDTAQVYPLAGRLGHPELNGDITAIGGDEENIYFALKNAAGNTYLMKGKPQLREWHTWAYPGANDCTVVSPQRAAAIHATNPAVVASYGTALVSYTLPGPGLRPEDDASVTFETDGTAYWPTMDAGTALYSKFLTAGRQVVENAVSTTASPDARRCRLSYALDGSVIRTELVVSEVAGITVGVPADPPRFTWLQPSVQFTSNANTDTPVLKGFVFDTTPNPPRRLAWEMAVRLGNLQPTANGGVSQHGQAGTRAHLIAALSQRVLLTDIDDAVYVVKFDNMQRPTVEQQAVFGTHSDLYVLSFFEMGATGYLSTWFGKGSKFLLPDLPGGAVGLDGGTPPGAGGSGVSAFAVFKPEVIGDHGHWVVGSVTHSFIRFPNVTVPVGATITAAYLRMRLFNQVPGTVDIDQYMNDVDDAVAPTDATEGEALVLTTATDRYTQVFNGAEPFWAWVQFDDISAVVQEVVDRAGWLPGQALTYVGRQRAVTGNVFTRWFDTQIFAASLPETFPELYIEWTV